MATTFIERYGSFRKIRALGPVALMSVIGLALFAFVFSTGSGTVTDVFKADEFNPGHAHRGY